MADTNWGRIECLTNTACSKKAYSSYLELLQWDFLSMHCAFCLMIHQNLCSLSLSLLLHWTIWNITYATTSKLYDQIIQIYRYCSIFNGLFCHKHGQCIKCALIQFFGKLANGAHTHTNCLIIIIKQIGLHSSCYNKEHTI